MWVRLKAAALHFLLSALVIALAFAWLRLVWYPGLLFSALGAGGLLLVVLIVDLLLGPLCTFVVFETRKPSLRFDMAVIVMLQFSALLYGFHTFWEGRPAYLVFNVDRLTVVRASELDSELSASEPGAERWYPLSVMGPRLVGAKLPEDREALNALTLESVSGGRDLAQMPRYYIPFEEVDNLVQKRLRPLSELSLAQSSSAHSELLGVLSERNLSVSEVGYLPVQAMHRDYVALLNRRDGTVLAYLDVPPEW